MPQISAPYPGSSNYSIACPDGRAACAIMGALTALINTTIRPLGHAMRKMALTDSQEVTGIIVNHNARTHVRELSGLALQSGHMASYRLGQAAVYATGITMPIGTYELIKHASQAAAFIH